MEKKIKILPPTMPNFLFLEAPPRPRQEGFNAERNSIPITDLSREEAEQFGELMKQTFIKHWQRKVESL